MPAPQEAHRHSNGAWRWWCRKRPARSVWLVFVRRTNPFAWCDWSVLNYSWIHAV